MNAPIKSHTCIFIGNGIFFISKNFSSVGSSAFQKNLQVLNQPILVFFLTFFENVGSTANFLSPKSNGQGFSFLILSPHHPKNVVKSFMHKIKGTEDKVDQYVTF